MFLIILLFTYVIYSACPGGGFGHNERDCRALTKGCGSGGPYAWTQVCYNDTWHECPFVDACYTCHIDSGYYIRSQQYPIRDREIFTRSTVYNLPPISSYKINSHGYAYSNEIYVGHMECQGSCGCSEFNVDKKIDMNLLGQMDGINSDKFAPFKVIWPAVGLNLGNEPWILLDVKIKMFKNSGTTPIYCCMMKVLDTVEFHCDNVLHSINDYDIEHPCSYTDDTKKNTTIKTIVEYWYVLAFMVVFVVLMLLIMGVLIYYRMKRNTIMDINDILDE